VASGAPDWERVVTLVAPSMTHGAPDWERTVVGPGGTTVGGLPYYSGTVGVGITDDSALGISIYEDGASDIDIGASDGNVVISAGGATGMVRIVGGAGSLGVVLETLTGLLGFYGALPIAKPVIVGSKGGNAALASLLGHLAGLGLLTDHST
jgi:hypothetical protein